MDQHHHPPVMASMDCSLGPCFFKVFLPELSSQQLTIPPAFRRHLELEARSHGPVSLTSPSGNTWRVDLATNSKGLCFHKGWKEFVADHSVQLGDFLVFRYDRSFHFTVWLFDTTACEKKSTFSAVPHREGIVMPDDSGGGVTPKRKRKSDGDLTLHGPPKRNSPSRLHSTAATRNSSTHDYRRSPRWPQKGNEETIERSQLEFSGCYTTVTKFKSNPCTGRAHGRPKKSKNMAKQRGKTPSPSTVRATREDALRVKSEMTEEFSVSGKLTKKVDCSIKSKPSIKQARGRPKLGVTAMLQKSKNMANQRGKTPSPFSVSEACEVALRVRSKTAEFSVPRTFTKKVECSVKSKSRIKQDKLEGRRNGSLLSQRRPVMDQEVEKALEMALSFKSKNPFVIVTMQQAYVYVSFFMHIPRQFTAEHLSLDSEKMTLWDPDGKPWPVNYTIVKNCGRIYGGWAGFSYAHNLELDDVCIFELIEKNQFKVHIFRVIEEVVPYIRVTKALRKRMSKS